MSRNKLYIILSIITIFSLFLTAATCSFCGMQAGTASSEETKIDIEEETKESGETKETKPEITETNEETAEETADNQPDDEDQNNATPTISLEISEGPTYSESDDVCYYRVKATVTGSPRPTITWSKDNSNGSFGNTIAQINLTRDNPSYTLTASAANSEGSATASINLSWGCDEETDESTEESIEEITGEDSDGTDESDEAIADAGGEALVTTLKVDKFNSGYLTENGSGETRWNIIIGDNTENKNIRGLISFDIRSLPDSPITDVKLVISNITKTGDPTFDNDLYAYSCYYGSFGGGDYELGSSYALCMTFPTEGLTSINESGNVLKSHFQAFKNNGYGAYQLKFIFPNEASDSDGQNDQLIINPDNVKLYVSQ